MDWHFDIETSPGITAALIGAIVTVLGAVGRLAYKLVHLPRALAAENRKEALQLLGDKQRSDAEVARLRLLYDECVTERARLQEREQALGVNLEGMRVVIAEDNELYLKMLEVLLSRLGVIVVGRAATGAEVVALVAEKRPEVTLMDLTLRGHMNGIEATRQIVTAWPAAHVMILSGADTAQVQAAIDAGASWAVNKDAVNLQGLVVALMAARA